MPSTGGLLPKVIASYNAGPAPIAEWNARYDQSDPLLYIESIPYWETRGYVPIVLRNYWIYEERGRRPARSSRRGARAGPVAALSRACRADARCALATGAAMARTGLRHRELEPFATEGQIQFLHIVLDCSGSGLRSAHARPDARPGRGAPENRTPTRFNLPEREADGDWLDAREELDGGLPPLRTTVTVEKPKTIITRNQSPDIGFDRSINAYRGCEHGCIYCFARPTHAFHDLSPGLDFETKLFAKPDAAKLLRAELGKPGYQVRPIAMGTNTDPYQPIEGKWRITRSVLEVLAETKHPVTITTKSDRVLRDLDILARDGRRAAWPASRCR